VAFGIRGKLKFRLRDGVTEDLVSSKLDVISGFNSELSARARKRRLERYLHSMKVQTPLCCGPVCIDLEEVSTREIHVGISKLADPGGNVPNIKPPIATDGVR